MLGSGGYETKGRLPTGAHREPGARDLDNLHLLHGLALLRASQALQDFLEVVDHSLDGMGLPRL